ncbi:glutamate--tRNA ligase [Gallionella capsiferriformans]|uniref:Glutamate--tRNA ligase n=1 Tax=Gallionella capsiferriformans (strain ES-2) TaxID=395494 RepID=D9SGI3_GALCS|nr:glutamate--tRNA ligase [Gallionella capsiferriformans]ADL55630.1 glutamyl-tRNA synthetase [Gallionella capsiferriformans ES-2]
MTTRTRFAPSPTGYLHIGGARTALFSWAYARKLGGTFILRIEDTDLERSSQASVQAILDGMSWLNLDYDEGPFYQMQRMDRYKEVLAGLIAQGHAYYCYTTPDELEAMREAMRARGEKPRYDGCWRPEAGKVLPVPPEGVKPVVRFKNPLTGVAAWDDMVKGRIVFENSELDDLIIARPDGTPTYNFCVVVDDLDMGITQVIRGDDHVNNTPRQINILKALGATLPQYAHVPMILGSDGERLSKRHGAVSVMQYAEDGFLPEALINYLTRLGWSHGDEEVFSVEQFVEWFDLEHISKSAAQFNPEKLRWLNQHYIKLADNTRLAELVGGHLLARGIVASNAPKLEDVIALYKGRVATLLELADEAEVFYADVHPDQALLDEQLVEEVKPALRELAERFADVEWQAPALALLIKELLAKHTLKMPKLAMPLRVMLVGQTHTPSVDAVLALFPRETVLVRMARYL